MLTPIGRGRSRTRAGSVFTTFFGLAIMACGQGRPSQAARPQAVPVAAPAAAPNPTHFGVRPSGQCCEGDTRVILTIPFEVGSTEIPTTAESTLRTVSEFFASHAGYRVEVDGHADQREGAAGVQLATARADQVKGALTALGMDAARLSAVGCGARMPVFQPPGGREVDSCVSFLAREPDEKPCVP